MATNTPDTIGQYLLNHLLDAGVGHIFGVPGDYVLGFYDLLVKSQIRHIGTTREDTAHLRQMAMPVVGALAHWRSLMVSAH